MAIAPTGRVGYFTNTSSGSLTVVNLITHRRHSVHLGWQLTDVAVSPNGKLAYVTSNGTNGNYRTAFVLDTAIDRIVTSIDARGSTAAVAFSPDGKDAYVETNSKLLVVNTATSRVVGSIATGYLAVPLEAVAPNGKYVYLVSDPTTVPKAPGFLEVVNVRQGRVTSFVNQLNAADPCGIAANPNGKVLYESFCGSSSGTPASELRVRVINALTGRTESRLPMLALGLAVSPDGKDLLAADYSRAAVDVINMATDKSIATVPLGPQHASGLGGFVFFQIAAVGHHVYAASYNFFARTGKLFVAALPTRR